MKFRSIKLIASVSVLATLYTLYFFVHHHSTHHHINISPHDHISQIIPMSYNLHFFTNLPNAEFTGIAEIDISISAFVSNITLHSQNLQISKVLLEASFLNTELRFEHQNDSLLVVGPRLPIPLFPGSAKLILFWSANMTDPTSEGPLGFLKTKTSLGDYVFLTNFEPVFLLFIKDRSKEGVSLFRPAEFQNAFYGAYYSS